ncbi:hypothetical protein [Planctomicrobium piriforme]|uniref:Uncharacterized protein n=1 Tax=Planctomicrobium piriforme TaxID=1576369 RepID=A0A1I3KCP3_9PLAN|nr:hypothetical protein [Planctomicrobium piriforme]SFI70286.1 hypothetical protein SAMN05421753_111191 [Planctomicrobium piriforme]
MIQKELLPCLKGTASRRYRDARSVNGIVNPALGNTEFAEWYEGASVDEAQKAKDCIEIPDPKRLRQLIQKPAPRNLRSLTVRELRSHCRELGIRVPRDANKMWCWSKLEKRGYDLDEIMAN